FFATSPAGFRKALIWSQAWSREKPGGTLREPELPQTITSAPHSLQRANVLSRYFMMGSRSTVGPSIRCPREKRMLKLLQGVFEALTWSRKVLNWASDMAAMEAAEGS